MAFNYTRSELKTRINAGIQNKIGLLISSEDTCNETVREVLSEIRIRSTRRKAALVPNLLNGPFEYAIATDLQSDDIIDIPAQAKREDGEFNLVPTEQFVRDPKAGDIAVSDYNGIRMLLINSQTSDESVSMDSLDAIGTDEWVLFGDGTNLSVETDDYVKGGTSIEYDISAAGGTTAGIQKTLPSTETIDLSEFISKNASAFTYARVTSATNLTNFKLRVGSSSANYYEYTVTTKNDGSAITAGWNLLRWSLLSPTTVGSPDAEDIGYFALFMTKTAGKVSETGYMFNWLEARKGKYADVMYYSKYGWQNSSGTYLEESSSDSDVLVADTDEFDIFVKKGRMIAGQEADLPETQLQRLERAYLEAKKNYQLLNPSEDKIMISSYYQYGSRDSGTNTT